MSDDLGVSEHTGWMEASGLPHIVRTLGIAVHPAKIGLALAGIVLTVALGGFLDWMWSSGGGIGERAIDRFILARQLDQPFEEAGGASGIFETWSSHHRRCVRGLLSSTIPAASELPTISGVDGTGGSPLSNLSNMVYGAWWMARHHLIYALLFGAGTLLIWSLCGGAICRIAAVQFAQEEKPTLAQGVAYARGRLFDGFFLAPCIPLAFVLITALLMFLGGVVLRIPVFGDVVGGGAFFLAMLGGFVIAVLMLGTLAGGSLFWPAVAVEGSDAFDAFSRGISYALSRPWKTVLYAILMTIFAAVCWIVVNVFTVVALSIARGVVAFGTSPFGWWTRGSNDEPISKLELLWPTGGSVAMHRWPEWGQLAWYECVSAFLIGLCVLLVVGVMWAFLASFFHSGATVAYFLLRRDVDGVDLEDVFEPDGSEDDADSPPPPVAAPRVERIAPTERAAAADAVSEPTSPGASPPVPIVPDPPSEPETKRSAPGAEQDEQSGAY